MTIKIVTAPIAELISLEAAKQHLRIDGIEEDIVIQSLITTAREFAENFTSRSLANKTYEYMLTRFPNENIIKIPNPPVVNVDSITYKDSEGYTATMDPSNYIVDSDSEPGQIVLAYGQSWPIFTPYPVHPIRIRYSAGYQSLPKPIEQAMLLLIGHWYEHREAVVFGSITKEVEFAVTSLLWPYRMFGW